MKPLALIKTAARAAAIIAALLFLCGCGDGTGSGSASFPASPVTEVSTSSVAIAQSAPTTGAATTAAYKPADASGRANNVPLPAPPAVAKENSKEGFEAFISYWFQLLSYAYETGDTKRMSSQSSSDCILCNHLAAAIDSEYVDGRWMSGGTLQTPTIEVRWDSSSSAQHATVQLVQSEIHYFQAPGLEHRSPTAATNDAVAFLAVFQDGAWKTTDTGIIR
ncbi:DUF6318 family protein [Paenarthrobacter sp. S56]|uniref:DUF6318 family protein n=1 Tax=Paenarthrobacter sp. S56 TaxID=3138179 RepID=UPI00321B8BF1